jgi:hypothetical protein
MELVSNRVSLPVGELGRNARPSRAAEIHVIEFGADYREWRHNITQLFFIGQYDFSKLQQPQIDQNLTYQVVVE